MVVEAGHRSAYLPDLCIHPAQQHNPVRGRAPSTYHVLVDANDRTTKYSSFTVNQAGLRGQWIGVGTFPVKGPTIGVKLLDRGDDWSSGWAKAHHAAAQMKATCRF